MEESKILVVVIVIGILLLSISLFVNINDSFDFIADPLYGEGLGNLCSSPSECQNFCQDNRGRCDEYCRENPSNIFCSSLFGGGN